MASHIPLLDIQGDSLRLVQYPGPRIFHRALPQGLIHLGRITDLDKLAGILRDFLREEGITLRQCALILPREIVTIRPIAENIPLAQLPDRFRDILPGDASQYEYLCADGFAAAVRRRELDDFRTVLRRAGITPDFALPREALWQNLLAGQNIRESVCLVFPEDAHWQAVFFHQGQFRMSRTLDGPQALSQILQIYRFSNPDAPLNRVYLPRELSWQHPEDWAIQPLEDLLPEGIPEAPAGAFSFRPHFSPKHWAIAAGMALAFLLFLYGGIYKPLESRNRALAELSQQQALAAQLEARLAGYDALADAYLRVGGGILTEAEQAMADRSALLDLVEQLVFPRANVTEFTLSGSTLTLHLTEISLQEAGALVSELKEHPLISQAQLHSAEADSGKTSSIYLRITLAGAEKEAES